MTSAAGAGFQSAKAGLQAVSAQTQWINQQVSAGKLALDPEVAEKAAKHCEDKARELTDLLQSANIVTLVTGLGDWPDGKQLTARFKSKGADHSAGALALIREYQKENPDGALLIITHSTRILDALHVDATHIMVNGHIVVSGDASLVDKINREGYEEYEKLAQKGEDER